MFAGGGDRGTGIGGSAGFAAAHTEGAGVRIVLARVGTLGNDTADYPPNLSDMTALVVSATNTRNTNSPCGRHGLPAGAVGLIASGCDCLIHVHGCIRPPAARPARCRYR